MNSEVLVAFVSKLVRERVEDATSEAISRRGPRGFQGIPGNDGKSFTWEENESEIRALIKESALKFSDLSEEEINSLRGPRGRDGKDGKDGPPGLRGVDGKSFDYSEHREKIEKVIREELAALSPDLKLKFSDLSQEEINSLRGPRGQRGKPGKDFNLDEHRSFFESLKFKFSDLTFLEKQDLKLKFSDLSVQEKEGLKLKFSDLAEEDILRLKGPRGQRGKPGKDGLDGKDGKDGISIRGPIGPPGVMGLRGLPGVAGINGENGKDAPGIYDIKVERYSEGKYYFKFFLTDGSVIETNTFEIPSGGTTLVSMGVAVSQEGVQSAPKLVATFDTDVATLPGHFVRVNGDNSVTKISDNLEATIPNGVFGVGFAKPSSTEIDVIFSGIVGGYSGLTAGSPVFISSSGLPTHTPPASGMVQQIGFAIKPTEIFVQLMQPMRRA